MNNETHTIIPYVMQFKLWSKVRIAGPNPDNNFYKNCWEYQGLKSQFGHGHFAHRGKNYFAHRVAYCLAHGIKIEEFPSDTVVRHDCDNPACCNPLHLRTGDRRDNQLDMETRGRNPKGDNHGMAGIDSNTVITIRYLFKEAGGVPGTRRAIAERLNIPYATVCRVAAGTGWSCVTDALPFPLPAPLTKDELRIINPNNNGGSNLQPIEVQRIRAMVELGADLRDVAQEFELAESTISTIANRKRWKHIPEKPASEVLTESEIARCKATPSREAENHHGALLNNLQVRELRWLFAQQGEKHGFYVKAAKRYGVSKNVVRSVCLREAYAAVADDFDTLVPKPEPLDMTRDWDSGKAVLSSTQIREIRWLYSQHQERGIGPRLAKQYGVTKENISSIVLRKTWTHIPDDFDSLDPKPTLETLPSLAPR